MSQEVDDQDGKTGEDKEPSNRSERKRQREKQRRSDLSNAFDELSAFIAEIEPDPVDNDGDSKKKRKKSGDGDDPGGITRLDLIGRAIKIMRRLNAENEDLRYRLASMRDNRGRLNDDVLVMVPNMVPAVEEAHPIARAAYPSSSIHQPYPPHPPHPSHHTPLHQTPQNNAYYQSFPPANQPSSEYTIPLPPGRTNYTATASWGRFVAPPGQQRENFTHLTENVNARRSSNHGHPTGFSDRQIY